MTRVPSQRASDGELDLMENPRSDRRKSPPCQGAVEEPLEVPRQSRSLRKSRPKLGFLGVGWIGRHRLECIVRSELAEVVAIAEPQEQLAHQAAQMAPGAIVAKGLDELLTMGLDGVVIATPSALHAEQAAKALNHGLAVFCQKPLGRTADETAHVVGTARSANLLLGVDLSYRFMSGIRQIHELCRNGDLGEIYAVDLVFHNAYGPDKSWFYDARLSGGGCVIDLGIHLVDLALWNLGFPGVQHVASRLYSRGQRVFGRETTVEDFAEAQLHLEGGGVVRMACSWNLPAGCDAIIAGSFYGTKGGARFHNVNGSFFDFEAEHLCGRTHEVLASGPEEWGGRAAVDWLQRLAEGATFDPAVAHLSQVANTLDAIYQAAEGEFAPCPPLDHAPQGTLINSARGERGV